jgi:putative endonuclease
MWYVYLLKCKDSSIYTGIAKDDVERRLNEHNNTKKGAKYKRYRRPCKLVYYKAVGEHAEAAREEIRIKKLNKNQKMAMIRAFEKRDPKNE